MTTVVIVDAAEEQLREIDEWWKQSPGGADARQGRARSMRAPA
jgi:hypothetical protein